MICDARLEKPGFNALLGGKSAGGYYFETNITRRIIKLLYIKNYLISSIMVHGKSRKV
jgi:hypothetical protein